MEIIDVLGKPCPIPVIEAKKALAKDGADSVLVKVDYIVSVQNLEKMAKGFGYGFSYTEKSSALYEVVIDRNGKPAPAARDVVQEAEEPVCHPDAMGLTVVISRDTMGAGAEDLGKILIKGFIYSLTELPTPPKYVIFLNSGAHLTAEGATTIEDLRRLEEKGTGIFTCGTCANYYGLQDKTAVGTITDMYGITTKMAAASKVINI